MLRGRREGAHTTTTPSPIALSDAQKTSAGCARLRRNRAGGWAQPRALGGVRTPALRTWRGERMLGARRAVVCRVCAASASVLPVGNLRTDPYFALACVTAALNARRAREERRSPRSSSSGAAAAADRRARARSVCRAEHKSATIGAGLHAGSFMKPCVLCGARDRSRRREKKSPPRSRHFSARRGELQSVWAERGAFVAGQKLADSCSHPPSVPHGLVVLAAGRAARLARPAASRGDAVPFSTTARASDGTSPRRSTNAKRRRKAFLSN